MSRREPLPPALRGGPFRYSDARDAGLTDSRTHAVDLAAPFHGIRMASGTLPGLVGLCGAYRLHLAHGAYFSHITAARLHGLPLPRRHEVATLHVSVVAPDRAPRGRGIVGHTASRDQTTVHCAGFPVLAAAPTWCQLAPLLTLEELIAAGDRLLGRPEPLTNRGQIERAVHLYNGKRGAKLLRYAYKQLRERVESPRETALRLEVIASGLPEPEVNIEIYDSYGRRIAIGDLVYLVEKVLLEYDGDHHRLDDAQYTHDVDRLNALAAAGWTVIRVGKRTSLRDAIGLTRHALESAHVRARTKEQHELPHLGRTAPREP